MNESLFRHISNLLNTDPNQAEKILSKQHQSDSNVQRLTALCRMKLDKHADAVSIFKKLIQKENKTSDYLAISAAYTKINDTNNAIDILYKLLNIRPSETATMLHLSDKLWMVGRYDDSLKLLSKYKSYNTCEILNKLADFYVKLLDVENAEQTINQSIKVNPNNAAAHLTLADLYNLQGDWKNGLKEQEWRVACCQEYQVYFSKYPMHKLWKGQPLNGKTLLIYGEQGYGDVIQHYRFIKEIKCANIILNCHKALSPLLNEYPTISHNASENVELPYFDYHILSSSLAHVLGVQEIDGKPYIKPNKDKIRLNSDKTKVGIVWAGNKLYSADRIRSIPVEYFNIKNPNIQLYSLQIPSQDGSFYTNLADDIKDFTDTADILSKLDILISCDTAVAHLAGALGIKTFLLVPYSADTRWENNSKTRWYDSFTIIRQKSIGNWNSVFAELNIT